jgi:acetate kinase
MRVLVFNCGSSSLKFELVELDGSFQRKTAVRGAIDGIGPHATYTLANFDGDQTSGARELNDHASSAMFVLSWLDSIGVDLAGSLDVVAHRVVHGGEEVTEARLVDDSVTAALERAAVFAPLHNPAAIAVMRAVQARIGETPSAVLPDTAFHRTLPSAARSYALPHDLVERFGIRRFGFHGIGHSWMMERYAAISNQPVSAVNLVSFQLGAGCSACAIHQGRSVDTSMGMTPLEGLAMATRSGDLDPAIIGYLLERAKLAPDDIERILNHESGLLGVSGVSADMREIRATAARGDERARLAIAVFVHRIRKYLGAYLVQAGPPNAILFGGGIGENDHQLRAQALSGLEWMGIELDSGANENANAREARISTARSRIAVWVIPLDEELYIARAAIRLVENRHPKQTV